MCKVIAEFLEAVHTSALIFINKSAMSGLLNITRTAIPPCFHRILSSKPKDGKQLLTEIGRGFLSSLKFEQVLKIQRLVMNAEEITL